MPYKENPKTAGSGIVCCIPQSTKCPNNCNDCFFQSGRSYLEPLEASLPNMPDFDTSQLVVRVNDGNDSNVQRKKVIATTKHMPMKFYNISALHSKDSTKHIPEFPGPVVLTVNPGKSIDWAYRKLEVIPANLMFVRVLVSTWNLSLVHSAVHWYVSKKVPVVLTFMAYHDIESVPEAHKDSYVYRKRTANAYYAIQNSSWLSIMARWKHDPMVYSCGKEGLNTLCKHCGNCLREYFATQERMKDNDMLD